LFVSCVVGPNVLNTAHKNDKIITTKNCCHGKNIASDFCRIRVSYSVIVNPIAMPTKTPIEQLARTKIMLS
jgi:hypothetical protein